jgi:hypothetical protein
MTEKQEYRRNEVTKGKTRKSKIKNSRRTRGTGGEQNNKPRDKTNKQGTRKKNKGSRVKIERRTEK